MYRESVSTFADLSVTLGAAPRHVQRVRFQHLKSADFLETRWGPPLYTVSSPREPCFVLVPYVLRPRRGLGQGSASLKAPRLQALETRDLFHQQNRKGKIVMTKTSKYKGPVLGSFLVPEIDMIFGDGVRASLECVCR